MILGECPEARLLDIRFPKPIQSEVVKPTSDAAVPELWHHIQGLKHPLPTETTPTASSSPNAM